MTQDGNQVGEVVRYFPAETVAAGFTRGMALIDPSAGLGLQVHASRRAAVGEAEVHAEWTDIFHILSGAGTFVTGGEVVDAREIAPGEIRGSAIRGGTPRRLGPGDVIVIPAGVPHWYGAVEADMTYFTVKVHRHR